MQVLPDLELIEELRKRLEAKDKAYRDLAAVTAKLEELNRKLVESEELKSSFLSNIRNEINNPLTSVLAMSELLAGGEEMPDEKTLKSIAGLIHKDAFSLNFQLRNIFAAAELEAGEAVPSFTNTDIESVLRESVSSLGTRASDKGVRVGFDISAEVKDAPFRTDAEKLQRIFLNLLANAIEYSREGGEVSASVWREPGRLVLTVRDNGAGIDKKDHRAVFERFKQLESGATKQHAGHGLGLSIVKSSVELLGGAITLESSTGKGAMFTVSIPEADACMGGDFLSEGTEFFDSPQSERF
ncbi:Sensor histidine kinase TmoS [uncultured bacterium]|nr:Sensor histidine kinase TmoS [uncultured bacterium]